MLRLFVETPLGINQTVRTSKEHKHYLEKVMRSSDVQVLLFNNKDGEFLATYASGQFNITKQTRIFESLPKKALAFGLIKSHRLSWLIEKSCELGVTDLYPLITERVQFPTFKAERYQRILIEAAEQCGRINLPVLHDVKYFDAFAAYALSSECTWYVGSLSATGGSTILDRSVVPNRGFIIGPEGGFTEKEEQALINIGVTPFSMGSLVLRAETAGLWCLV